MKKLLCSLALMLSLSDAFAQLTKADIFKAGMPVTFLGLDFTQSRFIGTASQYRDAGDVTNNAMKEKYIPAWNEMFVSANEQKNFKVADAIDRTEVDYAIAVAGKANAAISKKDFFSEDMKDFPQLDQPAIKELIRKYDYQGKSGLGMLILVEGMRKGEEKGDPSYAKVVVAFIDMGKKELLMAKRVEGKAGGFGFRNFWAGSWKNVLKNMKQEWKTWKKEG